MKVRRRHSVWLLLVLTGMSVLTGCNVTKYVPEGEQLLYKTRIEVTDTKDVSAGDLKKYLRQKPNSEVLGFWKLQLHIYNTAPTDTTTKSKKRLARNAMKMGEAPEIYSEDMTRASAEQLTKAMHNKGFYGAEVNTNPQLIPFGAKSTQRQEHAAKAKDYGRKVWLTYQVTANEPYRLRNCSYLLPQADLRAAALAPNSLLKEGMLFDAEKMDEERQRISTVMRRDGYFYFDKDMLCYVADSSIGNRQVDVELSLREDIAQLPDSQLQKIFTRYRIGDVVFRIDSGLHLRERMLRRIIYLQSGEVFDEEDVARTYDKLYSLGAVRYVDVSFKSVGDELLCTITLLRNKLNSVTAEIEGTYSAGDWGVAGGLGYVNRNLFHGAEQLNLNAKAGYEWRQDGGRGIEAKASAGLTFPNSLHVNAMYQYQKRPEEYTRNIANVDFGFTYRGYHSPWMHTFKFLDISYVYLPWISDDFREVFLQPTNILKYSYENHFIEALSYKVGYTSYKDKQPYRSYGTWSLQVETAGNALLGLATVAHLPKDESGHYTLGSVGFSQYAKADFNFVGHAIINEHHRFVFHGAIGVAIPYGNADVIPFEKRYFVGGANSIRGWTARTLGPGAYFGTGNRIDYNNQSGDIKLEMNVEYRWVVWNFIELAAFLDAGNIWTAREYEAQPYGAFRWDTFYKQLAFAYGAGLRVNLNFLVLRLDFGFRLHDPSRIHTDGLEWRTAANGWKWKDDAAVHFAIGYPF